MQYAEPYLLVIDSLNVLQLGTSLSVAGAAENKMVLNVEDRILIENLYKFKGYGVKNSEYLDKGWNVHQ